MLDLSKLKYRLVVMDENGAQYNIKDFIQNLGWEENDQEIAVRLSFTSRNEETRKGYLSSIIKPGCLVAVFVSDGVSVEEEVARGYVETWNPVEKNGGSNLKCTCYDELHKLQESQDSQYYPSGTGTKQAIQGIFDAWGIPQGDYAGPNAAHGKLVYNNRDLSYILLDLLDDAAKKGEGKCILRASKGKTQVIPRGSNKDVYVFGVDNSQSFSQTISMAKVTRVKIIGQADNEGKQAVEAVLDGQIGYGIRQKVYVRGSDENLADAAAAAQEILDQEGRQERTMKAQGPDVPFIRKGDLIYIMCGSITGYYYVKSIQHNADSYSMAMDLEFAEPAEAMPGGNDGSTEGKPAYKVGDTVDFHGGTHYVSSFPGSKGYAAGAGKAKITIKDGPGQAHPWHLIHADSGSNVYGWVDDGSFS